MAEERILNFDYESKKLACEIKENEAKYVSGELSLNQPLEKTDKLYKSALAAAETTTANKVLQDSTLMQLQSKIVRQWTKAYKPDNLVFEPRSFSLKLQKYYSRLTSGDGMTSNSQINSIVWQKLGDEYRKNVHSTPTFNFLYGTFNVDPAVQIKKKRKRPEKEKIAEAVKPQTISLSQSSEKTDVMMSRATRALSILIKLIAKSDRDSVCFYEFVTDPSSFTRTIENIFTVSLLVQNGYALIFPDEQGLPYLRTVTTHERKEKLLDPSGRVQCVLSMSVKEWKEIIRKFNFTRALIPPPRAKPNINKD